MNSKLSFRSPFKTIVKASMTISFLILLASPINSKALPKSLSTEPVTFSKAPDVLSPLVKSYIANNSTDKARVWVFYTDKNVFDINSFNKTASAVYISDKTKTRRAKSGISSVTFSDLPIPSSYVDAIVSLGGELRRNSKWLTASSFDIPIDRLDEIADLSFVREIRPVAQFKRELPQVNEKQFDQSLNKSSSQLQYGIANFQLLQINVDEAHDRGFDGTGVTIAILDTGFRKSHDVFAQHYLDGRVLGEYDFVFNDGNTANEPEDNSGQWNHGTLIWSVTGGGLFGSMVGPAYNANFLLCKTEDIRSETIVEEDNWMAAVEWADSAGADVLTSSLGYSDWYTTADYDGQTAITTIAANLATSFGIVVCNSMGNSGPSATTLTPPADAFEILSVGAVNSSGTIAGFSSRGPTIDGRTKPEVVALGVSTSAATSSGDNTYGTASGTSLSTPLVAGAAALLVQEQPSFPPQLIREALMMTADNVSSPNNNYGHGLINVGLALDYGSDFTVDIQVGDLPLTVQFDHDSTIETTVWDWDFGDGNFSSDMSPSHTFTEAGIYDVSLTVTTPYGNLISSKNSFVFVTADTITIETDTVLAGNDVELSIYLKNSMDLASIIFPFTYDASPDLNFDSALLGSRTSYFESLSTLTSSQGGRRFTFQLLADNGGGAPNLPAGDGEILKLYFSTLGNETEGLTNIVDSATNSTHSLNLVTTNGQFTPKFNSGQIFIGFIDRGDVDYSGDISISDITYMVTYLFKFGDPPANGKAGDINADGFINISDLTYLVDYMFKNGPPPPA